MNKTEFLEILRDYLKKDFSENEVNDILRDYEEYFVDGIIEGKSDMEIIAALGSPKSIAKDLISQMKEKDDSKSNKRDTFDDKIQKAKIKIKESYKKCKTYVSESLTPGLGEKQSKFSTAFIKVALILITLLLIVPAFSFITAIVGVGIALVIMLIGYLISVPFIISFIWSTPQVVALFIFASMIFIGCQIIAWQIFLLIFRIGRSLISNYINWLKTRNIYINASEKQDKMKKDIFDKEEEDENDEV